MAGRILLSLALALAGIGSFAPSALAGPESNIPGIPLPGSVATGKLGGPIVDVVYQIDLPPQRVLVLSLTGSAGTDFDIYLFDSSATSVYANPLVGLVAKSTGPTSTETVRYSTVSGGRFYIDLSSGDVEGDYRLSVAFGRDITAPQVSPTIDGGAPATNNLDASVSVVATDDLSGVADMQLSRDGTTWGPWTPWQPTTRWELADEDGIQSVWVRVSDHQGNISAPEKASILVDRVPPGVLTRNPPPNGVVAAPRPTLSVQFSEPIRVADWQNLGLILQDAAGTVIYGSYSWDAPTDIGMFTPSSDLLPGATYVVSLGTIRDLAGNPLPPLGSWVVIARLAPTITLTATPRSTLPSTSVQLSGSVNGSFFGPFTLQQLAENGSWTDLEPLLPDAHGGFFSKQAVRENTTFRVAYGGDESSAATASAGARILVRRSVTLAGPTASVLRSAGVAARVSVTALVGPSSPDVPMTMTLYRFDVGHRIYRSIATITRTSIGGKAVFAWRGTSPGTYAIRATTSSSARFAAGVSPLYRWLVR